MRKFLALVFLFKIILKINCDQTNFNSFITYLNKYSNKINLFECSELMNQTEKNQESLQLPCKLTVEVNQNILNEENINSYLYSSFMFGNLTEINRKLKIESKTNLRRFLKQINEYMDATHLVIPMPLFLR